MIAEYGSDFYKGMPAVTVNSFGEGKAWYVATSPDKAFLQGFMAHLCEAAGIESLLATPDGVEVSQRAINGSTFTFILNHNAEAVQLSELPSTFTKELLSGEAVNGPLAIAAKGVAILEKLRQQPTQQQRTSSAFAPARIC